MHLSQGGSYQPAAGYSLAGAMPAAVAIADVNGDGKRDVITANAAGSVSVLLGNGDGTLRAPVTTAISPGAQSLALGDFNGDGKPDAAVAGGALTVLLGKGDGTFTTSTLPIPGLQPFAVAVADLNGDGKLDLAVVAGTASAQSATLAIFLGQGNGTFSAPMTMPLKANVGTNAIAVADLNGDGNPDLAISGVFSGVDVLLGNGNGTFREVSQPVTETGPFGVTITDIDGDGKPDLLVPECCGLSDGVYLLGNGDGTFQAEQHFISGSSPIAVAVTKISGSGGPDLVVADQGGTWLALHDVLAGPGPIAPTSARPASGSGAGQTFTFTFTDSSGYENLSVVDVLINSALDGRHACYVAFVPSGAASGSVFLVDDAGDAGGPYQGLVLPSGGSISNSQCAINGANSLASGSGNTLTLTLAINFSASFSGNKIFYLSAQDKSSNSSGWQGLNTWSVPGSSTSGPGVSGMSPARTTTAGPTTYTFTFTDTNGWQDITVANVLINSAIDGRHACYLAFVPATNSVFLVDDAGDAAGPYAGFTLPGSGTASNSQCLVGGAGASVSGSGNTLTLTLPIAFSQSFEGNQIFFLAARNNTASSNWQAVGSAAVP